MIKGNITVDLPEIKSVKRNTKNGYIAKDYKA